MSLASGTAAAATQTSSAWDKTFPKSDRVDHQKVTFKNRYGISLVGDLYLPKNRTGQRLAAIVVGGPFAPSRTVVGLYAQTMAERGFVTLAFIRPSPGRTGGQPRNVASPRHQHRRFQRGGYYLGLHQSVDRERIGVIGVPAAGEASP